MANRSKATHRAKKRFVEALRIAANVTEACRAMNINRRTAYEWKKADPEFAAEWEEAISEAVENLEREAWKRAAEGWDVPITYQGVVTGQQKMYSDRLMELLLKAHRPEKYKDRTATEHSGLIQIEQTEDLSQLSTEELKAYRALRAKASKPIEVPEAQ